MTVAASVNATSTVDSAALTLKQPASATRRLLLSYLQAGSRETADRSYEAVLMRSTTAGSGGSSLSTPVVRDPDNAAATGVVRYGDTVLPTLSASYPEGVLLGIHAHQRAVYQWYAAEGHEIVIPKTNDAGVCLIPKSISSSTFTMGIVAEWEE